MENKKLRKRDRVLNVVKAGAKRTHKGFQKIQPVLNKVKPLVNPRNALLGFLVMSVLSPSMALASPNPVPDVGNVTVSLILSGVVEETTYHTSCLIPGSQWFNSKIGAPVAALGCYGCAAGSMVCQSVGWHTKGWKCMSGSMACAGYVVGAHRAAPHDPILTAARAATSPFEMASKNAGTMGSA